MECITLSQTYLHECFLRCTQIISFDTRNGNKWRIYIEQKIFFTGYPSMSSETREATATTLICIFPMFVSNYCMEIFIKTSIISPKNWSRKKQPTGWRQSTLRPSINHRLIWYQHHRNFVVLCTSFLSNVVVFLTGRPYIVWVEDQCGKRCFPVDKDLCWDHKLLQNSERGKNKPITRMHSSRMRTVRCSGRLGEGGCVCPGGVCPGGCVYTPPVDRQQTDTCKSITFPQLLLRTVTSI